MDVQELFALLGVSDMPAALRKVQELTAQAADAGELREQLATVTKARDEALAEKRAAAEDKERSELQGLYDRAVNEGRLLATSSTAGLYRDWIKAKEHHVALRASLDAVLKGPVIVPLTGQAPAAAITTPPEAKGARSGVEALKPEEFIATLSPETQERINKGPAIANLEALWNNPNQRARLAMESGLQLPAKWPWGNVQPAFQSWANQQLTGRA
jgi:hypothetical protein